MAMSKPVVTLILSLQHELTSKGIRVQVVLPGGTATDGWDVAGFPWQKMPPEIGAPFANHPAWFLDPVVPLLIGFSVNPITLIPLIAIEGTLQETERNVRDSSRCADVFILYFPNKTRRICSGSSSYNIGPLLGPEVSLKAFVAVVMIFRISCGECSSRFSKLRLALALVGIRRAVN